MGIYYAAVDNERKKYFESPKSIKYPGICHPLNPFGCMLVMKNAQGFNFELESDAHWDCYYDKDYDDISLQIYEEFKEMFPCAKEIYDS